MKYTCFFNGVELPELVPKIDKMEGSVRGNMVFIGVSQSCRGSEVGEYCYWCWLTTVTVIIIEDTALEKEKLQMPLNIHRAAKMACTSMGFSIQRAVLPFLRSWHH